MIVPFLFTLDEYAKVQPTHLWVAYKFYDFCLKNKYPVILQEKYAKDLDYYKKKEHIATKEYMQQQFQYKLPSNEQFKKISKLVITKEEEKKIINKYKTIDKTAIKILQEEDSDFEEIIEEKIRQIITNSSEPIEAIITWIWYPSLEKVAKKYNIVVLNYELSTIRLGRYRSILGYFKIGDKYDNKKVLEEFNKFKYDSNKKLLLNNKELVNLFIDDQHIHFINEIDKNAEYEVGIALGLKKDYFERAYDGKTYDFILKKIEKFIPTKKISLRSHPAMPFDESKYKYSFDHSIDPIEWITKCKSIVCSVSNIGYEAILFGRGLISTNSHMITSFGKTNSLDYYDPTYHGLLELNFLTFAYYAPYELMFDLDYIRYRLKENDIYKIYNYNQRYILKKYGLSINKLKSMSQVERFKAILNSHTISEDKKNTILYYVFEENLEEIKKRKMENDLIEIHTAFTSMINSKGWKLIEKVRKIKNR